MINLAGIEGFDWDDGNVRKSLNKHGVTQAEAEQIFASAPLLASDFKHSGKEIRLQALGKTIEGRPLHVTFTLRDNGRKIRVISARGMNRKERSYYEQET
jgi:uncharacterized DUF497 family protein